VTTISSVIKLEFRFDSCPARRWNDERRWSFSSTFNEDFRRWSLEDALSCLCLADVRIGTSSVSDDRTSLFDECFICWWLVSLICNDEPRRSLLTRTGIGCCSCLVTLLRRLDSCDEEIWTLFEWRGLEEKLVFMRRKKGFYETLRIDYLDWYLFDGLMMLVVDFLDG
jgi:hypothetical protein